MTLTVYENNRTDQPREIGVGEAADKVEDSDIGTHLTLDRRINLVLANIGSFDPNSEEYNRFEKAVTDELLDRAQDRRHR